MKTVCVVQVVSDCLIKSLTSSMFLSVVSIIDSSSFKSSFVVFSCTHITSANNGVHSFLFMPRLYINDYILFSGNNSILRTNAAKFYKISNGKRHRLHWTTETHERKSSSKRVWSKLLTSSASVFYGLGPLNWSVLLNFHQIEILFCLLQPVHPTFWFPNGTFVLMIFNNLSKASMEGKQEAQFHFMEVQQKLLTRDWMIYS